MIATLLILALEFVGQGAPASDWIRVAPGGTSFEFANSGQPFAPWGFNYDHDEQGRLLEVYWNEEWTKVEEDFAEMKQLGANLVRVHLQFGQFMQAPDQPRPENLARLGQLVQLAERLGLYLDLTGLGCYHKADVPDWYDRLAEQDRWEAQANFWEAIARTCAGSSAIFCYDLMNEPVVPGGQRTDGDWLGPPFAGKHFVQFITLDQASRERPAVAAQWIRHLVEAIRRVDDRHLVTVGLVDWSLDRPGLTSGFVPSRIVDDLDFLCVHIYPRGGKVGDAISTLNEFAVGKPVVLEETFPLQCTLEEFQAFLKGSDTAAGVVGFYWGRTPQECRSAGTIGDALMLRWLEYFQGGRPAGTR